MECERSGVRLPARADHGLGGFWAGGKKILRKSVLGVRVKVTFFLLFFFLQKMSKCRHINPNTPKYHGIPRGILLVPPGVKAFR